MQLQLREMIRQGNLVSDIEQGVLNWPGEMNPQEQRDRGREQERVDEDEIVVVDGHEATSTAGNQAEDFEMVSLND